MDKRILGLKESLDVIRHFRIPLQALIDERSFRLLSSLDSQVFANSNARASLGITRKRVWSLLAMLVEAGLIEKRGHEYRIVPSTYELANMLALGLRGLVTGESVPDVNLSALLAELGPSFIEWAYAKGKIDRGKFLQYERQLKESGKEGRNRT